MASTYQPFGIAVSDDTIYFSEPSAHVIRAISSNGLVSTIAGTGNNSTYLH